MDTNLLEMGGDHTGTMDTVWMPLMWILWQLSDVSGVVLCCVVVLSWSSALLLMGQHYEAFHAPVKWLI